MYVFIGTLVRENVYVWVGAGSSVAGVCKGGKGGGAGKGRSEFNK